MSIWKKAISVATSAALLASLLTAVAAPAAFAANTSAGGGIIYPDYAASAPFSITFQEDAVDQYNNGSFTVAVYDSDGTDADATFVTTVAPTVTRNLGVGTASAGFVGDTLVVNISGTDDTKIESWTIGGLKASAGAAAAKGALIFDVTADTVNLSQVLATATGTTTSAITGGVSTTVTYAVDAGSPLFQVTGTACVGGAASAGNVTVAASGVVAAETFSTSTAGGTFTKATPFTGDKPVGTAVSQSACAARFPSPVTVGDAVLAYLDPDWGAPETFQAGVNSQNPADLRAQLGFFDDLLLNGDVVTFTMQTAGVLFSPDAELLGDIWGDGITIASPVLGADRKSITVTITQDADAGDTIDFGPYMDVALNVPNGTTVDVAVTVSRAGVVVLDSPVTVAVVGYVAVGSTAAPTIYIGQNDQATGMITITESAAGVLTDDGLLEVCLQTDESWAVGRYFWAVVTSGDLKLNAAGLPVTQAKMTIDGDCLTVLPYTASTVASTIEIRDGTSSAPVVSGPTNGPKVNVPNYMSPGQTYVRVYNDEVQVADNIVIAVRAYTGTPTATTSGQLPAVRGLLNQMTGSITFTEGAPNQFGNIYDLELCLVYPSVSDNNAYIWSNPVGANAPVVTTNSTVSGLIASFDFFQSGDDCLEININDTGLSGLGTITISNLKLDVKTDAPLGPVFVRIYTDTEGPSASQLQATVSPATVVEKKAITINAVTALGVPPNQGPWSTATKVAAANKFITWKFSGGAALAGKTVRIYVATKNANGGWGPFVNLTGRVADASGNAYFWWRATGAWVSVRAYYAGDAAVSPSWSSPRQGRWLS